MQAMGSVMGGWMGVSWVEEERDGRSRLGELSRGPGAGTDRALVTRASHTAMTTCMSQPGGRQELGRACRVHAGEPGHPTPSTI
jgi:hypothetical protein